MAAYHPPSGGRRNKLRLDFNENTVGASPLVLDFIKRFLTAARSDHLSRSMKRARRPGQHFGVGTDELTLTNGTDEAIHLLVNTFIDEGQDVLILKPSYAMYQFYSQLAGAKVAESITAQILSFPVGTID